MRIRRTSWLVALVWLGCGPATAADLPVPVETVEIVQPTVELAWSFSIAPYVWGAGISGEVGAFGLPTVDVDASFSDIFDHLDFGAMLASELRYGRFGIATDLVFVKLSGEEGHSLRNPGHDREPRCRDARFHRGRRIPPPRGAGRQPRRDGRSAAVVGRHDRVYRGRPARQPRAERRGDLGRSAGRREGRVRSSRRRFITTGWAMAGGFGVSSDFMWDLFGGVGYHFNDHFRQRSAIAGWASILSTTASCTT